jgi:hypothetical protein
MIDRLSFLFGTMKGVRGIHIFAYSIYHEIRPICTSRSRICTVKTKTTALDVTCPRCRQTDTYQHLLAEHNKRTKPGRQAQILAAHGFKRKTFSSHDSKQKPFRDLKLVFDAEKEIRCAFHTLVVRMEAIRVKYKGGIRTFVDTYKPQCCRGLVALCAMSEEDLYEPILDIERNGLVGEQDFACFDAAGRALGFEMAQKLGMSPAKELRFDCPWLRGFAKNGGVTVYHADPPMTRSLWQRGDLPS